MKYQLLLATLIGFVCLVFPRAANSSLLEEQIWAKAMSDFEAQKFAESADEFAKIRHSSEAAWNRGVALHALGKIPESLSAFLRSLELSDSPLWKVQVLTSLQSIERQLSTGAAISNRVSFWIRGLFSKLWIASAIAFAFFFWTVGFVLARHWPGKWMGIRISSQIFAGVCLVFAAVLGWETSEEGSFAVIQNDTAVYRDSGKQEKLIDLVAGSILEIREKNDGLVETRFPVPGFLDAEDILQVNSPETETNDPTDSPS